MPFLYDEVKDLQRFECIPSILSSIFILKSNLRIILDKKSESLMILMLCKKVDTLIENDANYLRNASFYLVTSTPV